MPLSSPLPGFRLEQFFAEHEFTARHHLTASDAETLTVRELLDLAGPEAHEAFLEQRLGYIETWGTPRLRTAVAATYERCEPDDVLTFAGAEEALFWIPQLLLGPGDHAVVVVPNYQAAETIALAAGADVSGVELDPDDGWALDVDAVAAALRPETKLVAVNFPNNPTGAVPPRDVFERLASLCEERGVWLLSDEVYRGVELDPARTLPQAADLTTRAISVNVMSKSYGLPGLRVGWVACRDRELLERLEHHKHYTSICNATTSEHLAAVALDHGPRIHARVREILAANVERFGAFFDRHADRFEWAPPDGGCVCFPRYLGPGDAASFCRDLLAAEGVLLLPASVYVSDVGTVPTDRFRLGLGRRGMDEGLAALERFVTG